MTQEDLSLIEVSSLSFDHQRQRKRKRPKENVTERGMGVKEEVVTEQTSGIYTVANRTLINKVLYKGRGRSTHGPNSRPTSPETQQNNRGSILPIRDNLLPRGRVLLRIFKSSTKDTDDISHHCEAIHSFTKTI